MNKYQLVLLVSNIIRLEEVVDKYEMEQDQRIKLIKKLDKWKIRRDKYLNSA